MADITTTTVKNPSLLAKVSISFEYDKTLREIKHNVKARTYID